MEKWKVHKERGVQAVVRAVRHTTTRNARWAVIIRDVQVGNGHSGELGGVDEDYLERRF